MYCPVQVALGSLKWSVIMHHSSKTTMIHSSGRMADQSKAYISSIVSTWALAVVAVVLRFVSRRIARAGFWIDDWLMLPARANCTLLTYVAGVWRKCVYFLLKTNMAETATIFRNRRRLRKAYLPPVKSSSVFRSHASLFVAELYYPGAVMSVKSSVLALYLRLFQYQGKIPISVIAALVLYLGAAVV